ncbi:MAG: MBL fold metallo-hydrolase, partial [Methanomicrobiales archaeon]|nr:MBL fold metallo-hydrolase [Methanomicrobiales archaeon]
DMTGQGFYADVQEVQVSDQVILRCFQLPCGGNVFTLSTKFETVLIDTGYGNYFPDIREMLPAFGLPDPVRISRIIITHGDADHAGGAGNCAGIVWMHPATWKVIERANRAYGSHEESSVLEAVYTKLINTFSSFRIPRTVELFKTGSTKKREIFPVLTRFTLGDIEFEVLEGLGGHLVGQI